MLAGLYARVVAHESDALLAGYAPESIVDDLQGVYESWPRWNWAIVQCAYRHGPPPGVALGKRADSRTGEAAAPEIVGIRAELIAGQPVDLVLLYAVEDDLVSKADAIGRAIDGTLAANLAEIRHAELRGLAGDQRQVGHDRVGHVDARPKIGRAHV